MKTTATIFAGPDQSQEVTVLFEGYKIRKWFGLERSTVFINLCEIVEPLDFMPSDIQTDIECAIAESQDERPEDVRFECLINYSVNLLAVSDLQHETLFI